MKNFFTHHPARMLMAAGLIFAGLGILFEYFPGRTEGAQVAWIDYKTAISKAAANPKPIFIDVYADWCQPCRAMDQTVYNDSAVRVLLDGNFYPVRINGDDGTADSLLKKEWMIEAYPTMILLDSRGRELNRIVGYVPSAVLMQWLNDPSRLAIADWDDLSQAITRAGRIHKPIAVFVVENRFGPIFDHLTPFFGSEGLSATLNRLYVPTIIESHDRRIFQSVAAPVRGLHPGNYIAIVDSNLVVTDTLGLTPELLMNNSKIIEFLQKR